MTGIAILGLALLFGCALLRVWNAGIDPDLAWVLGPVLGLTAGFWVVYAAAWAFGALSTASLAAAGAALVLASAAAIVGSRARAVPWPERPGRWLMWTAVALSGAFVALNAYGILGATPEGQVYAVGNAWADTPFHTSMVTAFAYRDSFPPMYPAALGVRLDYPFLVNFVSAVLVVGGLPLRWSLIVVNALLHVAFVCGFMVLVRALTGSVRAALLGGLVLMFLGNLGVLAVPGDVRSAGGIGAWLRDLPWDYTGEALGTHGRESLGIGVYVGNPVLMYALPRRSGAFGLAVAMPALALAAQLLRRPSYRTAVLLGLLAGLMPRVHAHTAVALAVIVGTWAPIALARAGALRRSFRPWLVAGAVAIAVAAPQLLTMRAEVGSFLTLGWLGWTGEPRAAFASARGLAGYLSATGTLVRFWVLNGGFLVLLLPAALWRAPARLRDFWVGVAALWLVANSVKTQPWEWDNSAYFVYWQVGTVALMTSLLVGLLSGRRWRSVAIGALCVAGLVAGGPLSLVRTLQDRTTLWSVEEARFAERVRSATPPAAAILTSHGHGHPVAALSGRQVYMGFSGWLYTHGIDWFTYEDRLRRMLGGDLLLMRELGIEFAVVGPLERRVQGVVLSPVFEDPDVFEVVHREELAGEEWKLVRMRAVPQRRAPP